GGAEALARHTVDALRRRGVDARVLTTCVPDFRADWGNNALPRGAGSVGEAPVERFPVDRRDWQLFDQVNLRIMRGEPVTGPEAELVRRLFAPPEAAVLAVGVGLGTAVAGDAARFRASHALEGPFLLYVGRADHGKNLDGLLSDFGQYRAGGGRARLVRVGA